MRVSENVRTTITQDGAVLMNIKGGHMITLNPIGSIIWQQLSEGRSPEQIAAHLAAEFGISREQASGDVSEFLEQLETQHLIESAELSGSRKHLGPKPTGLFCNLFGRRNSRVAAQERGSK
jgi:Coenzyme PQQ synthesis protein D (PqqD)